MRAKEFIIEKAIDIDVEFDYNHSKTIRIWVNPTLAELQRLVLKYTLRGLAWDKLFLVWDGYEAIHNDIVDHVLTHQTFNFDNIGSTYVSLALSDENNIDDSFEEWQGDAEEANGIYYMTDYGDPKRMPSFRRSLKI